MIIVHMKNKPLANKSGRVKSLTQKDIKAMRSTKDVLPKKLWETISKRKRGERGPQVKPKKIAICLRLSPEVVDHYKATGRGWQGRIDASLKRSIQSRKKKSKVA